MTALLSLVAAVISPLLVTAVVVWAWARWRYRRQIAFARTLPTALPAIPLLGHIPYLTPTFKLSNHRMATLFWGTHNNGISCVWLGPIPWIVVTKEEDIRAIFNNSQTLGKSEPYNFAADYIGKGLLTAPVSLWKKSRKLINHIFSLHNLNSLTHSFDSSARHLVQDLAEHAGGGCFDVEKYVFGFTLINVLNVLYGPGFTIRRDADEFRSILEGAKAVAAALSQRGTNPLLYPDSMFRLLKRREWKIIKNMQKHLKELHHRRQQVKENSRFELNEGRTIIDVTSVLSEDPDFGEDYVDMELMTLIATGTDTNAITIGSCLLALGNHSEIQERLFTEIVSVVGENPGPVTLEDINNMPYLDQVLKETLRRFTVVPLIGRNCDKDVKLREFTIPQDSTLVLSLGALDLDPRVFPDPLQFDPDRFSFEEVAKRDNCFLPFSGGPRGCIGRNFAMIVMKMALVHILRSYEIRSDVEIETLAFSFGLAINSTTGYHISVKRRTVK